MFKSLKERFTRVLDQPIYTIATFVDPLTKSAFSKLPQSAKGYTINFIRSQLPTEPARATPSDDTDTWTDFLERQQEHRSM